MAGLHLGEEGVVASIGGRAAVRHRLMEMGLTRGTRVRLVRAAPFGDPLELELLGYRLSVRKSEAATVMIEAG